MNSLQISVKTTISEGRRNFAECGSTQVALMEISQPWIFEMYNGVNSGVQLELTVGAEGQG